MSPKLFLPILILIPLVVLALVFLPPSSPPTPNPLAPPARLAEAPAKRAGGEFTTSVEYLPAGSSADFIVFRVSLNTHSVDLDGIDFQKSVVLEKSGQKLSPLEANVDGSGHHRSAEVKFKRLSPPLKITFLETAEAAQQEFVFDELK